MPEAISIKLIPLNLLNYSKAAQLVRRIFPDDAAEAQNTLRRSILPQWMRRTQTDEQEYEYRCYLVKMNGSFIGLTGLVKNGSGSTNEIGLGWLGLENSSRGKGIGREVLEQTMALARQEGYEHMTWYGVNRAALPAIVSSLCEGMNVDLQQTCQRKHGQPVICYSFDLT